VARPVIIMMHARPDSEIEGKSTSHRAGVTDQRDRITLIASAAASRTGEGGVETDEDQGLHGTPPFCLSGDGEAGT